MTRTDWEKLKTYFHRLPEKYGLWLQPQNFISQWRKKSPFVFKISTYMTDGSSWFQQEFSWTLNIPVIQPLLGVAQNPAEPGTKCKQLYINLNCYSINSLGKKVMGNPSQIEQPKAWRGIFVSPALLKGQIGVQIRRLKHRHQTLFWARGLFWHKAKNHKTNFHLIVCCVFS